MFRARLPGYWFEGKHKGIRQGLQVSVNHLALSPNSELIFKSLLKDLKL